MHRDNFDCHAVQVRKLLLMSLPALQTVNMSNSYVFVQLLLDNIRLLVPLLLAQETAVLECQHQGLSQVASQFTKSMSSCYNERRESDHQILVSNYISKKHT